MRSHLGICSLQTLVDGNPSGQVGHWAVYLLHVSLFQGLTRYFVLHKLGADLELASCFSPCWINVLFSVDSNMKYIKSKLKTGQCFVSNAMGIFVFKLSFSTPQIFPHLVFFFFKAETIFSLSAKCQSLSLDLFRNLHGENGPGSHVSETLFFNLGHSREPWEMLFLPGL